MKVFKNNKQIIEGCRNKNDGLWDVTLPQQPLPAAPKLNIILKKDKSIKDLIHYY